MSTHGICFDNGMAGRCDYNCELFTTGQCEAGAEIVENMYNCMAADAIKVELECLYEMNEVRLFVLRGEGDNDLELMIKGYGY